MSERNDRTPAALYARVSSDRQDVDLSVSAQLRALRDYADKNDYEVVREYVDEAESGRVMNRPEFQKMLDEAKRTEAPFKEILVWKFSRFTRKREHAVVLKSMLRRKGLRVVSITEQAEDNPTGRLPEGIIESVDEFYSENLAMEVLRGMREAASRGFWVAPMAPYGYRKVKVQDGPKERPTLEPDPETTGIVKRIFDLAESRKGMLKIVRILNDEGIASPRGKLWNKPTVHNILRNEAYLGTLVWGNNAKDGARPGAGGKGVPRHRRQGPVRPGEQDTALPRPQGLPPPQGRKHLPAERPRQVLQVQEGALGPLLQQGHVPLLRLPLLREARARVLRLAQGRCPAVRGAGRRPDSLQHPHRGQHSEPGQTSWTSRWTTWPATSASGWRPSSRSSPTCGAGSTGSTTSWRRRPSSTWPTSPIASETTRSVRSALSPPLRGRGQSWPQRRAVLDDVKTITAYAKDMSRFLQKSELTERRAFIETFVKEIELLPDNAVVRYSVPMPDDSLIPGKKVQEIPLNGSVVSSVNGSPPNLMVDRTSSGRATRSVTLPGTKLSSGMGTV